MGDAAEDILSTFNLSEEDSKKYETVKSKFQSYFVKTHNVIYERARFNQRKQEAGESVNKHYIFQSADLYCRKCWRRVQHLANEFWARWRKEYLLTLQHRQKWFKQKRNLCVGDVVMLKDGDVPRNRWQLVKLADIYPSADGTVRKMKLEMADSTIDAKGRRQSPPTFLDRPVQKVVLLQASEAKVDSRRGAF